MDSGLAISTSVAYSGHRSVTTVAAAVSIGAPDAAVLAVTDCDTSPVSASSESVPHATTAGGTMRRAPNGPSGANPSKQSCLSQTLGHREYLSATPRRPTAFVRSGKKHHRLTDFRRVQHTTPKATPISSGAYMRQIGCGSVLVRWDRKPQDHD